jgi:hypothetical protein
MLGLRKLGDVIAGVPQGKERLSLRQRYWFVERSFPAAIRQAPANHADGDFDVFTGI